MNRFAILVGHVGQYLVGLSDKTRLRIVVIGLLVLGGTSIYKLVVNVQNMKKPLPTASPDALIKPMEQLVRQTSLEASAYQKSRQHDLKQLDSLKTLYYNQPKSKP